MPTSPIRSVECKTQSSAAARERSTEFQNHNTSDAALSRDRQLDRDVYCICGVPIDNIGLREAADHIAAAMEHHTPLLFATSNLNFLAIARRSTPFQESLIASDLNTADGMAVIWIGRLLGIPFRERVAGSDLFEELKARPRTARTLTTYFFGGASGVGDKARALMNAQGGRLRCAGCLNPGYGSIDEMSTASTIAAINASNADFLMVSLGAAKGQEWLMHNRHALKIPVQAHLGATLNFQAGTQARAPRIIRRLGLEWAWRVREEPKLWRRYWHDGAQLLRLVLGCMIPARITVRLHDRPSASLRTTIVEKEDATTVRLIGVATARHIFKVQSVFNQALQREKPVVIDLSTTCVIDARVLGACLMLKKQLSRNGCTLTFGGASRRLARLFRQHGAERLLDRIDSASGIRHLSSDQAAAPRIGPEAAAKKLGESRGIPRTC